MDRKLYTNKFFYLLKVRDEQGLKRFHGAFKGGWSAGYFNTVGSKEGIQIEYLLCFMAWFIYTFVATVTTLIGWAPSTFVSSRKNRSDRKNFKPEDFMDEEDLEVSFTTLYWNFFFST